MGSALEKKIPTTEGSPIPGVDFSGFVQLAATFTRHALTTHRTACVDMTDVRWLDLRTASALAAFISWARKQHMCPVQVNLPTIANGPTHLTVSQLLSESSRGNEDAQRIVSLFRFLGSFGWFKVLASVEVGLVPYGIKELDKIHPYAFRTGSPDQPETTQSDVVFDLFSGRFTNRAEVEAFAEKNHFWEWFQQLGLKSHSEEMGTAVSLLFHDEALRFITGSLLENVVDHCGDLADAFSSGSDMGYLSGRVVLKRYWPLERALLTRIAQSHPPAEVLKRLQAIEYRPFLSIERFRSHMLEVLGSHLYSTFRRDIESIGGDRRFPSWLGRDFGQDLVKRWNSDRRIVGAFEICVSDDGPGMAATLRDTLVNALCVTESKLAPAAKTTDTDVLMFAFGEDGSRKAGGAKVSRQAGITFSATRTHALHKVLCFCAARGGLLRVASNCGEITYNPDRKLIRRPENRHGLEAHEHHAFKHTIVGTHLQIVLPIIRDIAQATANRPLEIRTQARPTTSNTPEAAVIPIKVSHDFASLSVDQTDTFMRTKGHRLVRSYLQSERGHTIAIDFRGANQDIHYIEAVLYCLSPVLTTRPTVVVGLDPHVIDALQMFLSQHGDQAEAPCVFCMLQNERRIVLAISDDDSRPPLALATVTPTGALKPELIRQLLGKGTALAVTQPLPGEKPTPSDVKAISAMQDLQAKNEELLQHVTGTSWRLRTDDIINWTRWSATNYFQTVCSATKGIRTDFPTFRLPDGGVTNRFFEVTRMLQNRPFSDWACFLLACSVRQQMPEAEFVFVCTTAPARLLADGISEKIHFAPPVFDIGHWFNFRQSPVLRGLTAQSRDAATAVPPPHMVLVTDLVNSGKFLLEMRKCTKATTGALPACAVSLMRRTAENRKSIEFNPRWSDVVDPASGETIPVFSLFDYGQDGLAQPDREREAIIDYYGMHPYSRRQLIEGAKIERGYVVDPGTDVDRLRMDRVRALDTEGIIRFGHYVHEDKHFSLVAAMRDLFLESPIGGDIVKEVAQLIRQSKVKHILIPAHSHIKYIIPRLRADMQEHMPPVTTLVESRQVAPRPFYFLPQELVDTLAKEARPSILILDDGARSGRTFETIVRAVARAVEDRPVSWTFYFVIDRMGIARTTTLDQLSRRGAGRGGRCIYFFIHLEYPAAREGECSTCADISYLQHVLRLPYVEGQHDLKLSLQTTIADLSPTVVDTPAFRADRDCRLPLPFKGEATESFSTLGGAILWLSERIHRGCPPSKVLEWAISYAEDIDKWWRQQAAAFPGMTQTQREQVFAQAHTAARITGYVLQWYLPHYKQVLGDGAQQDFDRFAGLVLTNQTATHIAPLFLGFSHLEREHASLFEETLSKLVLRFNYLLPNMQHHVPSTQVAEIRAVFLGIRSLCLAGVCNDAIPDDDVFRHVKDWSCDPRLSDVARQHLRTVVDWLQAPEPAAALLHHFARLIAWLLRPLLFPDKDDHHSLLKRALEHCTNADRPATGCRLLWDWSSLLQQRLQLTTVSLAAVARRLGSSSTVARIVERTRQLTEAVALEYGKLNDLCKDGECPGGHSWSTCNLRTQMAELQDLLFGPETTDNWLIRYNTWVLSFLTQYRFSSEPDAGLLDYIEIDPGDVLLHRSQFTRASDIEWAALGEAMAIRDAVINHTVGYLAKYKEILGEPNNRPLRVEFRRDEEERLYLMRINTKLHTQQELHANIEEGKSAFYERLGLTEFGFQINYNNLVPAPGYRAVLELVFALGTPCPRDAIPKI